MKPERAFIAERPVAQHAGLAGRQRGADAVDPASALARLAERLSRALPDAISALWVEAVPRIGTIDPREGIMRELLSRGTSPCIHGLVAAGHGGPALLVSVDTAGALQLVDMAFGGEGKLPDPLPEKLPLSAQLIAARIEEEFAAVIARAAGIGTLGGAPVFAPVRRDSDIAALRPFAADRQLWQIGFEIAFPGCEAWHLRLTFAAEHLGQLCNEEDEERTARPSTSQSGPADPAGKPFGDIPLTLRATLVDMRIPLSRIAALKPGYVLPVSVARRVPLSVGNETIAFGTVGELDDRVALQITQAFPTQEKHS